MSDPGRKTPTPEIEDDDQDVPEIVVDEPENPDGEDPESGEEDDDPEPEGGDEPENPDELPEPAPKQSRAERRIQALATKAKAAEDRAADVERQMNELKAAQQGRQTEEAARAEQARLELMSPDEKYDFLLRKQSADFDRKIGMLAFQQQDNADKVAFDSRCARAPYLADVAEDVERELANMRRQTGTTAPRETIAYYLLGKRAADRAAGAKTRQKKKGDANIARQTAKPGNARSDTGAGGGRRVSDQAARTKRLQDIQL